MKSLISLAILLIILLTLNNLLAQDHNAGSNCLSCHPQFKVCGTVFSDFSGTTTLSDVSLRLIGTNGEEVVLDDSNSGGNLASPTIPDGNYLIEVGNISSKTWHNIPAQASCNTCHKIDGNASEKRTKLMNEYHGRIPKDNDCTHCHHFPASMSLDQLMTPGVLVGNKPALTTDNSYVRIKGINYDVSPGDFDGIETVRPDIFAPGFFSAFDAILETAKRNNIEIEYVWDDSAKTHWIISVDGDTANYWYRWNNDNNDARENEINKYKRANRWDEFLWRTGTKVALSSDGEDVPALRERFRAEIAREKANDGSIVDTVEIKIRAKDYKGNPEGSGRITANRAYSDVRVTAHNLRAAVDGSDSLYARPFQPGVVTSMDVLFSLMDEGKLNVSTVYFDRINKSLVNSHYIQSIEFLPEGILSHASGSQGYICRSHLLAKDATYTGGNSPHVNDAAGSIHMPHDILPIHAPDYSVWQWMELGTPYYESQEPTSVQQSIIEDWNAIERGFNLHSAYPNPFNGSVNISFNIFDPEFVNISVYNLLGQKVATLFNEFVNDIGVHKLTWQAGSYSSGTYYIVMNYNDSIQTRSVSYVK